MTNHKEKDLESKKQRSLSRRAQLRQQQRAIDRLNHKISDYTSLITKISKDLQNARTLTPSEKAQLAYEDQGRMQALNAKICEIGACVHKEHRK